MVRPARDVRSRGPAWMHRGPSRILVAGALITSTGTGLFMTGGVLYYTRVVHLSVLEIGLGLSLAGLVSIMLSLPAGIMTDRLGPRRVMVAANIVRTLGYVFLAGISSYWQFLVLITVITVADRVHVPANQAMVGTIFAGAERARTMALLHSVRNVGFALGAALGGLAVTVDTPLAFRLLVFGNAFSYLPLAFLFHHLRRYQQPVTRPDLPAPQRATAAVRDVPFVMFAVASGMVLLNDSLLVVALPLWIADHTDAPHVMISVALVTNTVLTALGQVWWTRWTGTVSAAACGMVVGGGLLAVSCAVFVAAHFGGPVAASVCIVVGIVVFTAGENLHSASSWQALYDLSPTDAQSRYFSVFNIGVTLQEMIGPAVVTTLALTAGPVGWAGMAAIFVAAGSWARASIRWSARRRVPAPPLIELSSPGR